MDPLYVDNAKIYHANALKLACAELNIKLLHRPPRDPAPGGLIERFFQTLQGQLEAEIRATHLLSLGDINRALSAWLEVEYHQASNSETGLDFHSASRRSVWSLSSFATFLAKLLGRQGGLSSFRPDEFDALRAFHARHDRVNETLLRAAVATAESPTIPHVLLRLQSLLSQGDA